MKQLKPQDIRSIVFENYRRLSAFADDRYDPIAGVGAFGDRISVSTPVEGLPTALVPRTMVDDPRYAVAGDSLSWRRLRCAHDFEYWCASVVRIKPKHGYRPCSFVLNRPQRRILAVLEGDRLAGRPIRIIVLKSRQWGCSTLIQNYMAWIQLFHRTNWHSLVCCHKKDCAFNIRNLYTSLIADYPRDLWTDDTPPAFRPFEGSPNVRVISGRECRIAVASSDNQDAIRGYDIAMAHLSEVAFWRAAPLHSPDDVIRSVCGSVALLPLSLIAMESTANGVGSYFHQEWERCKNGLGDKHALFIPWYQADDCSLELDEAPEVFAASLSDYELRLWQLGCTLQQILWYRRKALECRIPEKMHSEYPTDDTEAFSTTDSSVFSPYDIESLQEGCRKPDRVCEVVNGRFFDRPGGPLSIWRRPEPDAAYIAAVDVGGRSDKSDWSVIAVMRRPAEGDPDDKPEIVAQWRGHCDHDRLADIALTVARLYNEALLVIESNSLESGPYGADGAGAFILQKLADTYSNIYRRPPSDVYGGNERIGFQTNRRTKTMLIAGLVEAVRDGSFTEHSSEACFELAVYQQRPNGSYGAAPGYHDDILMTRALALFALSTSVSPHDVPDLDSLNPTQW